MRKACDEEKQNFKKELTEFGRNYDLHGAGFKRRQEETKRKIELLQDELLLLKTGTHSYILVWTIPAMFLTEYV